MSVQPRKSLDQLAEQFSGVHHARFIDADVPLHVIARVFQGRHLLRPCNELNTMISGVIGRAQQLYSNVRLYAVAFLSNHAHFMLQGPPSEVPPFIGFIKREISRRWGRNPAINWRGTMWHEYLCSALPTSESQVDCLKYVLSQGTKEGLVARPQDWPGVHCARALLEERPLNGSWLNATGYSRAIDSERRKRAPKRIRKKDHQVRYAVRFDPIPAWKDIDPAARKREVTKLVKQIEDERRAIGRPVLGARAVRSVPLERRSEIPAPPWFARTRRMICWSSPTASETISYVARYWAFQRQFREAANRGGQEGAEAYPVGAFIPGRLKMSAQASLLAA